eukprot:627250-Prorocentrum_minimum.AAC.1
MTYQSRKGRRGICPLLTNRTRGGEEGSIDMWGAAESAAFGLFAGAGGEAAGRITNKACGFATGWHDADYVAIEVVVDEAMARELIAMCTRLGAHGIFTYPVNVLIA